MTLPTLTFDGRLPGVDCRPALPPVEQPIRGDVAAFVGLAERGPLDTPVPLADAAAFATVFGGEYALAAEGGRPVPAQLPGAVKAFFDNGGVRCYAVRVAGPAAVSARWAVSGLQIWQPGSAGVGSVVVTAAWPGRWSADLQVSVAPIARPLTTGAAYQRAGREPGELLLDPRVTVSIQPGDLLDLRLGTRRFGLYVRVAAAAGGVVLTDRELAYGEATEGSPSGAIRPAPAALGGLPSVVPVASVTLLRTDLMVQRLVEGQLQLVERFPDLAYAGYTQVLQRAEDPVPDLRRSMNVRADAGSEQAAVTGLVVPVEATGLARTLVTGEDDLDTFDPLATFVDERLGAETVFSLPTTADALTSLAADPVRFRGMHALLGVDEVAMVALPDVTQRSWSLRPPAPAEPEPEQPPPPPAPDWSDFRCCTVAALPSVPPVAPVPVVGPRLPQRELDPVAAYDDGPLLAVQQALVTLCAARADLVALLSVPEHYDTAAVLDWHEQLTSVGALAGSVTATVVPLSYAAYWHPWLTIPDPQLGLRPVPPDGAVAGLIAARERARGIWVAPAAVALRGPVGLVPTLSDAEAVRLFDAHANVIRQLPGRFAPIAAHTLAEDRLLQLSVRRLLIWLRKIALRAGERYTFEVNNEQFRRLVQRRFEAILADVTRRGAFHAFQVVTDAGVNTSDDLENGRLVVALQVAPSSPVEFVTVSLIRSGEGLLEVQEE